MVETCTAVVLGRGGGCPATSFQSRLLRSHASLGVIDLLLRLEPAVLGLVLSLISYATTRSGQIGHVFFCIWVT